jgi:hypothetical protein
MCYYRRKFVKKLMFHIGVSRKKIYVPQKDYLINRSRPQILFSFYQPEISATRRNCTAKVRDLARHNKIKHNLYLEKANSWLFFV